MRMKKQTKKPELNQSERHFGVLLENMDSKFDLMLEGQQALDKKIDKNHQELREFRGEVDYKFGIVFEKLESIDDELKIIRNELKEKVGRDEFLTLEKRVIFLEKKMHSRR